MRWVLIVVGILVSLVVLMMLIGATLPRAHVASRSATFRAPSDQLWQAIADPSTYPSWRTDIQSTEMLPPHDGHPMWREKSKTGIVSYEAIESRPPQTFVAKIADPNLPYGGTWTYTLEPATAGTRVTITERGEIYNPLFRFLARFVFGYTATMEAVLQKLGGRFGESGLG